MIFFSIHWCLPQFNSHCFTLELYIVHFTALIKSNFGVQFAQNSCTCINLHKFITKITWYRVRDIGALQLFQSFSCTHWFPIQLLAASNSRVCTVTFLYISSVNTGIRTLSISCGNWKNPFDTCDRLSVKLSFNSACSRLKFHWWFFCEEMSHFRHLLDDVVEG
jgi:hypothetical protein